MFRRLITTVAALVTTGLVMTGCGAANPGAPDASKPLRIMADVTPHAVLLKEAEKQGLLGDVKIQVTEISGDIDPNQQRASWSYMLDNTNYNLERLNGGK